MKTTASKWKTAAFALAATLAVGGLAGAAGAQTKRKPARKPAVATPQPVPVQPVIISQAEQYRQQNQQIIDGSTPVLLPNPATSEEPTAETFDQKLDRINNRLKEMSERMKMLEGSKASAADEKQRRLLLNLDILTRAEQRAETLRRQLFELVEKENSVKTKIETIDYDARPEAIERQVALAGSLRPEELREMRRKNLAAEKRNLQNLLAEIQTTRTTLEQSVQKADQLVEKLRGVLEKEIDDALTEKPAEQP